MEFTQKNWGQSDIINRSIKLTKHSISHPQYSNMKKYYLYIYAYKPGYISSGNDRVHADARSQCDMINKIKILTKHGADMIHAVILTK